MKLIGILFILLGIINSYLVNLLFLILILSGIFIIFTSEKLKTEVDKTIFIVFLICIEVTILLGVRL